jgi:AraC-like DNA-binding protein
MKPRRFVTGNVDTTPFGFSGGRDRQRPMERPAQHNEVELNFIHRGGSVFQHGDRQVTLSSGDLIIYWAAVPHQVMMTDPDTELTWLVFPLAWFLSWGISAPLRRRLLDGKMVFLSGKALPENLPLARWAVEIRKNDPDLKRIVRLELEAFFRRLARQRTFQTKARTTILPAHRYGKVAAMVSFMTEHFHEPITVAQVADAARLAPEYAMRLFRRTWGMTIWNFLQQQRIARAQRFLLEDEHTIVDVAFACGFGSISRFYVAFGKQCGCTPRAYRKKQIR